MATIRQVKEYFKDKGNIPCPITEKLVKAGYQQSYGGYVDIAINKGIPVDYKQNSPSQYWHLMNYCDERDPEKNFPESIVCGELIFWMAEVSGAFPKTKLKELANRIINEPKEKNGERPIYDRTKWNKEIHKAFFYRIIYAVERNKDYSKPIKRTAFKSYKGPKWWQLFGLKEWLLIVALLVFLVWLIIDEDSLFYYLLLPFLCYAVLKDLLKLK